MTDPDYKALCAELRHFVAEYQQMRGLDPENIYSIHEGIPGKEAHIRVSQLTLAADLLERLSQAEPVAPTDEERIEAAFVMGQTGAPPLEIERLAFESWMRGHSWQVEGVWNGTTYDDRGPTRISSVDVGAMQTRRMWATWRDCATLARYARPTIQPVPVSERLPGLEELATLVPLMHRGASLCHSEGFEEQHDAIRRIADFLEQLMPQAGGSTNA
jgi:hypothetical protein